MILFLFSFKVLNFFCIIMYNENGDKMRYLIIAKDFECKEYIELMRGTDKEISEFTSKKKDSGEVRVHFKKKIDEFKCKYNDNGDIVIVDDTLKNKRIKVLYKKDKVVFKYIILNKKFMLTTFKSWLYKVYTEADIIDIRTFKGKEYEAYIKKCFKNKKTREDYYDIVRKLISLYEDYCKENSNLISTHEIYINYLKRKQDELKKTKKNIIENSNCLNGDLENDFYMQVLNIYENGGIEEVFLYYSIDDLYSKLTEDELKSIELSKTK